MKYIYIQKAKKHRGNDDDESVQGDEGTKKSKKGKKTKGAKSGKKKDERETPKKSLKRNYEKQPSLLLMHKRFYFQCTIPESLYFFFLISYCNTMSNARVYLISGTLSCLFF